MQISEDRLKKCLQHINKEKDKEKITERYKELRELLELKVGGPNSHALLKAPDRFYRYLSDVEHFMRQDLYKDTFREKIQDHKIQQQVDSEIQLIIDETNQFREQIEENIREQKKKSKMKSAIKKVGKSIKKVFGK